MRFSSSVGIQLYISWDLVHHSICFTILYITRSQLLHLQKATASFTNALPFILTSVAFEKKYTVHEKYTHWFPQMATYIYCIACWKYYDEPYFLPWTFYIGRKVVCYYIHKWLQINKQITKQSFSSDSQMPATIIPHSKSEEVDLSIFAHIRI